MPFKPKKNKNIEVDKNSLLTVENIHTQVIDEIKENVNNIPKLIEKYNNLKKMRTKIINKKESIINEKKIRELKELIKEKKSLEEKYFNHNLPHLFEYFEDKKDISQNIDSNKKIINSFFFKNREKELESQETKSITQKYLTNVNKNCINMNSYTVESEICQNCKEGELIYVDYEGVQICDNCGKINSYIVEHDKPSYRDPPQEVSFFAYKRINHFREIIAQFQAKETTEIPDEIMENIKQQIKKERITLNELTNSKSKDILKKLGYNKYYEHIPFIKDKLGIKPPVMSQELETILCSLFMEIEKQYSKHCPNNRVNFLNYYYVLFKLCELLNEKHFLKYFPMLKDQTKKIEQDVIWKKICKELNWTFYPTI